MALWSLSWDSETPLLPHSLSATPAIQESHCTVLGTVEGKEETELYLFVLHLVLAPESHLSSSELLGLSLRDSWPLLPQPEMAWVDRVGPLTPSTLAPGSNPSSFYFLAV